MNTSSYNVSITCPVCGEPAMRSDYVRDSVSCPSCERVYASLDEIEEALVEDARRWWRDADDFTRGVLKESRATVALKRLAVRLLELGCRPAIVYRLGVAVNAQLPEPVLHGALDEAMVEAAQIVARRRGRAKGAA